MSVGLFYAFLLRQNTVDRLVEIMFADPTREVVYSWGKFPVNLYVGGDLSVQRRRALNVVVNEFDELAGKPIIHEIADITKADIMLVFSENNSQQFEYEYENYFRRIFGEREYRYWEQKNAFSFPYQPQHPCFGFGLYHPSEFKIPGFAKNNTPSTGWISLANMTVNEELTIPCLREELAHLIFFIPDFEVDDPNESIFNSNPHRDARQDFSDLDIDLMRFIANHSIRHMNRTQFKEALREHLPG